MVSKYKRLQFLGFFFLNSKNNFINEINSLRGLAKCLLKSKGIYEPPNFDIFSFNLVRVSLLFSGFEISHIPYNLY